MGIVFGFIAGVMLRLSPALDIIHELMHYGWCNVEGITVTSLEWNRITYASSSALVLYGGYMSECALYGSIVLLLSGIKQRIGASFFLGIVTVAWLVSFTSSDFNEYALKLWGNQASVTRVLIIWGIYSTICVLLTLKVFIKSVKVNKNDKIVTKLYI